MNYKAFAIAIMLLLLAPTAKAQCVMPVAQGTQYVHPWQGRRVAYLGDSITDPRNNGSKKKFWHFLQEWLQIEPLVYGRSGRQWNDVARQADLCHTEHGDSIDAIIIFMGTNDFNSGVPLGEWYEVKEDTVTAGIHEPKHVVKRLHREPLMDNTTYRGRINIALNHVKSLYPTKQIVVLTPIHRSSFWANEKNWQPTEQYANATGAFITDYVQASREAADVWAVPVIDLSALSGLFPLVAAHHQYFKEAPRDLLHPNDKGHERMARTLVYQLGALPCLFEQ